MAVNGRPCFVSSCKIIHFGINPVIGGRPPRDNIVIIVTVVRIGALVQLVPSILIFVEDMVFSARKAVDVIVI